MMGARSTSKSLVACALLALLVSPAAAQPGPTPAPAPAPVAPAGPVSSTPGDGQVPFQRKTQLTIPEQLTEATRHIARMDAASITVRRQLESARRQRDVVRTLCLNDKLSQIDVAGRAAKERRQGLQAAANRNDTDLANHEFTILTVHRQRVEQLVAEANQCIGEESAFIGDTRVQMTVDPNIPQDDTQYPPSDPTLVAAPPQCTSCTL